LPDPTLNIIYDVRKFTFLVFTLFLLSY